MSTIYNKTDNYALNLYGNNDPADLRDGYNGSMRTIDTTLKAHLDRIEGVESRETHNEEVAEALLGDNTVDAATAAKTKWDNKADAATTYSKTDVDNKLATKADAATTYGKTDVDNKLATKADAATTYSKTETDDRIETLRPVSNVLDYGVKNDGQTDVTDALNSILSTGHSNLFFPDGVYAISDTLNVPAGSRITLSSGAIIRAVRDMGTMIALSRVIDSSVSTVIGGNGQIDGNGHALNGIVGAGTTINVDGIQISKCKGIALDLSHAHAAIVKNVVIVGNGSESVAPTTIGIKTHLDSQFSDIRMWYVFKMFETRGMNLFTNIYGWCGGAYDGSVGFDNYDNNEIDIRGENIYVDSFLTAIHSTSFAHISIDNFIPMFNNPGDDSTGTIYDVPPESAIDIRGGLECYSNNPFTLLKRPLKRINNIGFIDDIYTLKSNLTDFNNYCSTRNSSLINKFVQLSYSDITIPPNKCIKVYKQQTAISKAAFYNTYGDLRGEIIVADWDVASNSGSAPSGLVFMKKKVDDGLELYLANIGTTDFILAPTYIKLENVGYSGLGYGFKFDANSLLQVDSTMTRLNQ